MCFSNNKKKLKKGSALDFDMKHFLSNYLRSQAFNFDLLLVVVNNFWRILGLPDKVEKYRFQELKENTVSVKMQCLSIHAVISY